MAEDHMHTDINAFGFTHVQTLGPSGPGQLQLLWKSLRQPQL